MGCSSSNSPVIAEREFEVDRIISLLRPCLEALNLTIEEVDLIRKSFKKVDITRDGSVDVAEFEIYLKTERAPFNERALRMYDSDGSGQLEFPEFLLMCWTYCTMDSDSLEKFVFDLYDTNNSGIISGEELETLAKDLFGGNVNSHVHAIVRELPKGDVEFHQFQHFLKKHEALMLPALELQSDLRRSVIHESFWVHKALDRRNVKVHLIDEALVLGHRVLKEQSDKAGKRRVASSKSKKKANVETAATATVTLIKAKNDSAKLPPVRNKNSVGHANPNIDHPPEHKAEHHQAHLPEHKAEHHQVHHVEHHKSGDHQHLGHKIV